MLVTRNWLYGVGAWFVVLFVASASVAQPPTGGPVSDNPAWYHWIAGYASDYLYVTDNVNYPWVRPDAVPVVDVNVPLDWHNPTYWMDYQQSREMVFPPDDKATWFIGGDENPATTEASVTVLFSQDRDGNNGTTKVGSFAVGGGNSDQIVTLIIAANMSPTGMESPSGNPITPNRPLRVGRSDSVFEDTSYDEVNGFNKALHSIPWGVVKQTTGLVEVDFRNLDNTPNLLSDLRIQSDKDWISGSVYEIGGDASLRVGDALQVGDRGDNTTFDGVTLGHGIFRVRGSNVGEVTVGFQEQVTGTTQTGDFTVMSGAARGDVGRVSYDGGTTYFSKVNGGKSILEFVLDEGGVTPIEVFDELRIGRNNHASFFAEQADPVLYGFMRIKLMAPTLAGSGAVGSGDELVLVRADRVNTSITELGGSQLEEGRFMDPDRDLPGVFPHRPLLDGGTVISDFAGATYTWMINYFESMGGADDDVIDDALVLSNLMITGTPGDLLGDGMVGVEDRNALLAAIANPPALLRDLIGGAQHLFDLNADDEINHLDLATFDTYWPLTVGVAGDYNGNGVVDAADYTFWRDRLGQNITLPNSDSADMDGVVTTAEYDFWKSRFGATSGSGSASLSVGSVPEPGSLLLAALGAIGLAAVRRRGVV
jgi:hypothetical protein